MSATRLRNCLRLDVDQTATIRGGVTHQTTQGKVRMSDVMSRPHQLIASDRVEGTAVRRPNGDKIGHIERLMIDKVTGQVSYAILSFGASSAWAAICCRCPGASFT